MNVKILLLEETEYWTKLPDGVERVWGRYIFDPAMEVHCCELTPSYEMFCTGFEASGPNGESISDEAHDEIMRDFWLDRMDVEYMHCSTVNRMNPVLVRCYDGAPAEYEDMDEAIEDDQANPYYCPELT